MIRAQADMRKQSEDKTIKLIHQDLTKLGEIIPLADGPGGLMAGITMRIIDEVERGPLAHMRGDFALKTAVEKEIMKCQNNVRKISDDFKQFGNVRQQLLERIDKLADTFI